ncbi:MAG: hypothetical protein QXP60_08340 [Nitrososphaerota archaeon]
MPSLRVHINKDLELKFREAAMRKFGYSKGALSRAAEEAIEKWLSSFEEVEFKGDPINALEGLLSDIKISSVELQHSARKLWSEVISKNVPH